MSHLCIIRKNQATGIRTIRSRNVVRGIPTNIAASKNAKDYYWVILAYGLPIFHIGFFFLIFVFKLRTSSRTS